MGASADAKLDVTRTAQESTVMASFYQRLFTVSIVTPATPADYFSPDFTTADLNEQAALGRIAPTNPPVVVGSMSFGRVLVYSVTSTASTDDLGAAIDAAYSGGAASGSISLTDQQKQILNNARYQVVALGGNEADVLSLIKTHTLGDYFTHHSDLATAVPISYQVNNIVNDSAAKFTETTNYNLTECQKLSNHSVVIGAKVQVNTPNAYLTGPASTCDAYGNLDLNGNANWQAPRDHTFHLDLHIVTPLNWTITGPGQTPPNLVFNLYFDPSNGPQTLYLSGSLNCWNFIWGDPSNQYRYTWNVTNGSYGDQTLTGGSAHANVNLMMRITKLGDITQWQP
jgi:hypothetical protein